MEIIDLLVGVTHGKYVVLVYFADLLVLSQQPNFRTGKGHGKKKPKITREKIYIKNLNKSLKF